MAPVHVAPCSYHVASLCVCRIYVKNTFEYLCTQICQFSLLVKYKICAHKCIQSDVNKHKHNSRLKLHITVILQGLDVH